MLRWDHNAYYHRVLLRALPAHVDRVLEVGCGTGLLATKLAGRAGHVDALDRDAGMVAVARSRVPDQVNTVLGDVLTHPLEPASYDAVVSMSTLHHLELRPALARLSSLLRPGGVLAAVALPRPDLPRELPIEAAATTWHHTLGLALAATRNPLRTSTLEPLPAPMPMRDAELTTREVRAVAAAVLPGSRVRRLVLWRYSLVWSKPRQR